MRRVSWLILCVGLAACQPGAIGKVTSDPPSNPIVGDDIATTTLDAPAADGAAPAKIDAPDLRAPIAGTVDASGISGTAVVADKPEAEVEGLAEAEVVQEQTPEVNAPPVEEPAVEEPVEVKSADQLRCEARGGVFAAAEDGGARGCVRQTRDGGKRCDEESDCQGQCLARSQTCAPIDPLLGCNEVLQQGGAKVTLCLN
jgi:putative hemolysin